MTLYEKYFIRALVETNSTTSANMAQPVTAPDVTVYSADTYAPDDARVPKVIGSKKKKKKKQDGVFSGAEAVPIARRTMPETVFLTGKQ